MRIIRFPARGGGRTRVCLDVKECVLQHAHTFWKITTSQCITLRDTQVFSKFYHSGKVSLARRTDLLSIFTREMEDRGLPGARGLAGQAPRTYRLRLYASSLAEAAVRTWTPTAGLLWTRGMRLYQFIRVPACSKYVFACFIYVLICFKGVACL